MQHFKIAFITAINFIQHNIMNTIENNSADHWLEFSVAKRREGSNIEQRLDETKVKIRNQDWLRINNPAND